MVNSPIVSSIAAAITRQENVASVQPTINNPGAIMDLPYYKQTGKFRLATYNTPEEGQNALEKLITWYVGQGYTLEEMFAKYAPSGHGANDPTVYAKNVSAFTGIPLGVPIKDVVNGASTSPVNTDLITTDVATIPTGNSEIPALDTIDAGIASSGDIGIGMLLAVGVLGIIALSRVNQ
jgi:hypothetical protein